VGEIHLAGFAEDRDGAGDRLLIDDHGAPVDTAVWALYRRTLGLPGLAIDVPTLIERDNDLPPLAVLEAEAARAAAVVVEARAPGVVVAGHGSGARAGNPVEAMAEGAA
jgi:hypothetical protein